VVNENHTELLPIERIDMLTMAYDATCNLSCPSCRLAVRGKGPKSAAIQEILLSSGIFKHVNNFVTSGNGDPLASPLFWELVKALPGLDCPDLKLTLQTNGNLLTPKTWERLGDESRRVSEISVSVDAARKETYKLNRRGGDWDLLMANLEVIKRRGVMLQMNFVVQANNYKEMLEFMGMADAFGAYRVFFSGIENWGMFTDDEYVARAVHKPGHPEHEQLLETLRDPKLQGSFRIIVARLPKP
jgi:MoaA/NifB/PqqE/SkfB family radical SAM enzyme